MEASLPDGPRGRLLASALTLTVLAALWFGVASPLLAWYADRADALERRTTLARRMATLADSLPELQRQAAATAAQGPPPASVLEGATDAIAGATLQERVQDMARRAGANLSSIETLPAEPRGAYRRIGLRIAVAAPWPVLVHLLEMVEQASPRMLVDDLQLRGLPIRVRSGAPPIDASLTILAFSANASASAAAPGRP